jgi:hypothetical protein
LSSGGEQAGLAALREAQLPRVRAYVAAVCSPNRAEEAISAAFVDFRARAGGEPRMDSEPHGDGEAHGDGDPAPDRDAERELLRATRSAAAGRFLVVVPQGRPELSLAPECRAMPELLALHANGERPGDEALIAGHLAGCAVCAHTLARVQEAERAFAHGTGVLPALEIEATTVDTTRFPARPAPPRPADPTPAANPPPAPGPSPAAAASSRPGSQKSNPTPEPESTPQDRPLRSQMPLEPGGAYRRRTGGLVGVIRKFGRAPRG